jgi:hypothetical protein
MTANGSCHRPFSLALWRSFRGDPQHGAQAAAVAESQRRSEKARFAPIERLNFRVFPRPDVLT